MYIAALNSGDCIPRSKKKTPVIFSSELFHIKSYISDTKTKHAIREYAASAYFRSSFGAVVLFMTFPSFGAVVLFMTYLVRGYCLWRFILGRWYCLLFIRYLLRSFYITIACLFCKHEKRKFGYCPVFYLIFVWWEDNILFLHYKIN